MANPHCIPLPPIRYFVFHALSVHITEGYTPWSLELTALRRDWQTYPKLGMAYDNRRSQQHGRADELGGAYETDDWNKIRSAYLFQMKCVLLLFP